MARQSRALLRWRSRQPRGAIVRPSTFRRIVASARRRGARNPTAVAGKAYWRTARSKFRVARRR